MHLLPTPDADGIAKAKEIVFNQTGRIPSDEEAARLLGGIMRYLYLLERIHEQVHQRRENSKVETASDKPLPIEVI